MEISAHDPIRNLDGKAKAVFVKREEIPGRGVSGGVAEGIAGGVKGGVASSGVAGGVTGEPPVRSYMVGVIGGIVPAGNAFNSGHAPEGASTISGAVSRPLWSRHPERRGRNHHPAPPGRSASGSAA